MGIFDGCLLACDIDGTLMISGYINPRNVEKIEYFMSEGGKFSISTGRSVCAIGDVLSQVKRISPSIVANGCMIYDYSEQKILYENILPESDHYLVGKIINSGINAGIEIHCGSDAYTANRTELVTEHQVYEKFEAPDVNYEDITGYKWHKVICTLDSVEDRAKLKEQMLKEKSDCDFIETCAVIGGQVRNYFELVPKGVSKATALQELCKLMKVKKGGLFAAGDYYNDVAMLKLADISAVPCDSPEDIKVLAQHITCKCDDGAVADFIDYLTNLMR